MLDFLSLTISKNNITIKTQKVNQLKQYILAFITALLFSSFAIAETPKQLTEGEYADYIPLVSSPVAGEVESSSYFPPNI